MTAQIYSSTFQNDLITITFAGNKPGSIHLTDIEPLKEIGGLKVYRSQINKHRFVICDEYLDHKDTVTVRFLDTDKSIPLRSGYPLSIDGPTIFSIPTMIGNMSLNVLLFITRNDENLTLEITFEQTPQ